MATIGVKIELEGAPKYTEDMQNLTAQTKLYQAQVKRLTTEMGSGVSAFQKSITESKALGQQLEAQKNQSKLLEEQITKSIEKYGEESTQVIKLKTQYENLQTQIAKTSQALEANGGIAGAIGAQLDEVGKKLAEVGDKITALGTNLSKTVSAPIVGLGTAAVKTAADFDTSMSQVAATMGYTVADLNDETSEAAKTMKQLSDFAQDMGKSTAFSASEAADALNYMALAGYDAETSMSMLPTVLDLAAAGGIGLAEASDMVTDAASALGLSIDETSVMVDQMAKASSKSNTSVAQLGEAILKIGATAANMNGGTLELAKSLGVLADNGIKGAEGGTHLRNMIMSLQDAAKDGAVDFGDFAIEVYDSEGNFKELSSIIVSLQSKMQGMSQEAKDALLSGVFNKTDLAAVNAMLGTSVERFGELTREIRSASFSTGSFKGELEKVGLSFDELQKNIDALGDENLTGALDEYLQWAAGDAEKLAQAMYEDADATISYDDIVNALGGDLDKLQTAMDNTKGAAANMAEVQLDNLNGQITLLKSALEGIGIQFGTIIMPYVQKFVEKISEVIDWIANLDSESQALIVTVGAVVAAIGPALMVVGHVIKTIGTITSSIGAIFRIVPTIIGAASSIGAVITGTVIPAIGAVVSALIPFLPIIAGVAAAIAGIVLVVKNWGTITEWLTEKWETFTGYITEKVSGIQAFFEQNFGLFGQLVSTKIEIIKILIETAIETIRLIFVTFGQVLQALFSGDWELIGEILSNAWESIKSTIKDGIARIMLAIQQLLQKVKDKFSELKNMGKEWGEHLIQNFIDGILAKWEALKQTVANVAQTVKDFLGFTEPKEGPLHNFNSWPRHMMENYANGIEEARFLVRDAINNVAQDVTVMANPMDVNEIYDAVRSGASDATLNLAIGDREFSRTLRSLGVQF